MMTAGCGPFGFGLFAVHGFRAEVEFANMQCSLGLHAGPASLKNMLTLSNFSASAAPR